MEIKFYHYEYLSIYERERERKKITLNFISFDPAKLSKLNRLPHTKPAEMIDTSEREKKNEEICKEL